MNPIEKRIAEVLNRLVTTDDVLSYSVAEQVVAMCNIKGLTADDVIKGRTSKAIAELWMHRRMAMAHTVQHVDDSQPHQLLPFSKIVHHDIVHHDGLKRWTFPVLLRTKADNIDVNKLKEAVEKATNHHPVFSMYIDDNGEQQYKKGYRSPYIEAKVYQQDEYIYLSLTINRILGDAASFVLFAQNIWRAYRGEELTHDGYLQYLCDYETHTHSNAYKEHALWLTQQYDKPSYPLLPMQDSPDGTLSNEAYEPIIMQPDYAERLAAFSGKERVSINAFYCLATALAIMDHNATEEAGLTWAYLGRESRDEMNIFGSLHRDIPMKITKTKTGLLSQLRQQMEQGIINSDYPFTLLSPEDSPWHNAVNVLVQPSMTEAMEGSPTEFEFVPLAEVTEPYCMLDIDITLTPLTLTVNYSPRHYTKASIQRFTELINKNAKLMLEQ